MPKFEVVHDLLVHDGHAYTSGATVELGKDSGDALVEQGAVRLVVEKAPRGRVKADEPSAEG